MESSAKIAIIPAPALFDARITPQQLRTLAIISSYGATRDRGCWPSYTRLCSDVGISRRLLIGYINHLCECGYLEKQPHYRKDGAQGANLYRVVLSIEISPEEGEAPQHGGVMPESRGGGDAGLDALKNNKSLEQYNKKNINKKRSQGKLSYTLLKWEEVVGSKLCMNQMRTWIREKNLDETQIPALIEEFRTRMLAGGNMYADFIAAFQVYLRRGYLAKSLDQVANRAQKSSVVFQEKGISL